jgi:hypothetical protein
VYASGPFVKSDIVGTPDTLCYGKVTVSWEESWRVGVAPDGAAVSV